MATQFLLEGLKPYEIKIRIPGIGGCAISSLRRKLGLPKFKRGRLSGLTEKTKERREEAIRRYLNGESYSSIYKSFGVSKQCLNQILFREKHQARSQVYRAVRAGKLIRPKNCSKCGRAGQIESHHSDYSKPLQVEWLCHTCHCETKWSNEEKLKMKIIQLESEIQELKNQLAKSFATVEE